MDGCGDEHASLKSQVAELRAVNAALGRALAAADSGTPLRSSLTAALMLSQLQHAEHAATLAGSERDAAVIARDRAAGEAADLRRALAERAADIAGLTDELAVQSRDAQLALAEVEHLRTMLNRRSVRTAQRAAKAAGPIYRTARRLRRGMEPC